MMLDCLSCKTKNFLFLYKIKKFPLFWGAVPKNKISEVPSYPFEVSYCEKCGLVQQSKLIKEIVINKVYTAQYYNCPSPIISDMGVSEIEKFLNFFLKCKNKPGKILEIACFDGYLLEKLKKLKWDVYGCDPCPVTDIAINRLGRERIRKAFFKDVTYPKNYFDEIIFRNLLVAIYNPNSFLKTVRTCLKENGKIFIDVPNLKEIIKRGSFGFFYHQNVSYFTLESLKILLSNNGFKITNYFEGKPNLFVEAIKINKKYKPVVKNYNKKILKEISKKNNSIKKKITKYFDDKKIKRIIVFGSSGLSTTLLGILNKKQKNKIKLVVDNDKQKHNKILSGSSIEIFNPKEVLKIDFDIILICSHFCSEQIKASLKVLGVNLSKVRTI